jgi:hypothetical protein
MDLKEIDCEDVNWNELAGVGINGDFCESFGSTAAAAAAAAAANLLAVNYTRKPLYQSWLHKKPTFRNMKLKFHRFQGSGKSTCLWGSAG